MRITSPLWTLLYGLMRSSWAVLGVCTTSVLSLGTTTNTKFFIGLVPLTGQRRTPRMHTLLLTGSESHPHSQTKPLQSQTPKSRMDIRLTSLPTGLAPALGKVIVFLPAIHRQVTSSTRFGLPDYLQRGVKA